MVVYDSTVGFLAGEALSAVGSVGVSGFFRLIKWLMSLAFLLSAGAALLPAPEPEAPLPPLALADGGGGRSLAIVCLTMSSDCNEKFR